jgi:hypothetical protein
METEMNKNTKTLSLEEWEATIKRIEALENWIDLLERKAKCGFNNHNGVALQYRSTLDNERINCNKSAN